MNTFPANSDIFYEIGRNNIYIANDDCVLVVFHEFENPVEDKIESFILRNIISGNALRSKLLLYSHALFDKKDFEERLQTLLESGIVVERSEEKHNRTLDKYSNYNAKIQAQTIFYQYYSAIESHLKDVVSLKGISIDCHVCNNYNDHSLCLAYGESKSEFFFPVVISRHSVLVGPVLHRYSGIDLHFLKKLFQQRFPLETAMVRNIDDLYINLYCRDSLEMIDITQRVIRVISRFLHKFDMAEVRGKLLQISPGHHTKIHKIAHPDTPLLQLKRNQGDTDLNKKDIRAWSTLKRAVSPFGGLIPYLQCDGNDCQGYVCNASAPVFIGDFSSSGISSSMREMHFSGKGESLAQAKVSCIAETIERVSCYYRSSVKIEYFSYNQISDRAVHPNEISLYSERQFENGKPGSVSKEDIDWIPERLDLDNKIDWVEFTEVLGKERIFVPAASCFFGYRSQDGSRCLYANADSNGCAARDSIEGAILEGMIELIERDALSIFWYNRISRESIDLSSALDPYIKRFWCHLKSNGRELNIINITTDIGVPVILALSWEKEGGRSIHLGVGAHLSLHQAMKRALSELNQSLVGLSDIEGMRESKDVRLKGLVNWLSNETIENHSYLNSSIFISHKKLDRALFCGEKTIWENMLLIKRLLVNCGIKPFFFEMSRLDISYPVVRVIAPGLRSMWPRFGQGRLYDVPVKSGIIKVKLAESELNPIGFFL